MIDPTFRADVLAGLGATPAEIDELLVYNENPFDHSNPTGALDDEPFVAAWRRYAAEAEQVGVAESLQHRLVQFQFPIREGINETDVYRKATRRGHWPNDDGKGLAFEAPERLRLVIHPTPAGHIPLLITEHRADFVSLVRALLRHNEPTPVPDTMGAVLIAGYNNWDRIRSYREAWAQRTAAPTESAWHVVFRQLVPQKSLYQDHFILLSDGPYSAIPAEALGLDEPTWRRYSLVIRCEHECAHYYTRRVLGTMRTNMLDELIADYMGIVAAAGHYRADWFLRFVGLEAYPEYRTGGRLENYRGNLSDGAFGVLQQLVYYAAHNLERHSSFLTNEADTLHRTTLALQTLTRLTLEALASEHAGAWLRRAYEDAQAVGSSAVPA